MRVRLCIGSADLANFAIIAAMPYQKGPGWDRFAQRMERFGQTTAKVASQLSTSWEQVTEGMALNQLWDEFKAEAQAGNKSIPPMSTGPPFKNTANGRASCTPLARLS
jgi:hypothetical protein